jgi:hypothetical protein
MPDTRVLSQFFESKNLLFLNVLFVGLPHLATFIFLIFSMIEPELGAGIDPGMALTLTISI